MIGCRVTVPRYYWSAVPTLLFIYISQLLKNSFSVSQQPPIWEPPSHYSICATLLTPLVSSGEQWQWPPTCGWERRSHVSCYPAPVCPGTTTTSKYFYNHLQIFLCVCRHSSNKQEDTDKTARSANSTLPVVCWHGVGGHLIPDKHNLNI